MKIAMLGYGKMGKAIEEVAGKRHQMIIKVDENNINELTKEDLSKADVAIEFSTPASAPTNILMCMEANVPVVVGTTGWLDRFEEIEQACYHLNGAFLYASNFSVGVNIFFELNKYLSEVMDNYADYGIEITEIHHTEKKDKPSGTAITLAEDLLHNIDRKSSWINESTASKRKLSIISKRKKNIPGTHNIVYKSDVDSIVISHEAHSRLGFAQGALLAANWIIEKKGVFGMEDVLQIGAHR